MTQLQQFLKEIEQEAITTRKMLSIVPDEKYDWKPHAKSMSIRQLATHIAELPTWPGMALTTDGLDFAVFPYEPKEVNSTSSLLALFEESLEDARNKINEGNEEDLPKIWTLRNGDNVFSADPKGEVIRMSISQTIHHRAQLGVYLRLLDIPIPGSYGPSADEMGLV